MGDDEHLYAKYQKQGLCRLQTIEEKDLTDLFKKAHTSLWSGGQLNPSEAFDELDKLIFCKIWDERNNKIVGKPYEFQIVHMPEDWLLAENKRRQQENEELYNKVVALYNKGKEKDVQVFKDNIRLTPEKIRTVVEILQHVNLSETDLDSKGRAFETFLKDFFRGNFGQFFTPRSIVKFIVNVLPIKPTSKVLDTSCGSGGFLLYVLDKVRHNVENSDKKEEDKGHILKSYKTWHDFASNNLFGIEINEQISRVAKMNMIIHDDGHTNVVTLDALFSPKKIEELTGNTGFQYGTFDFILTNPPFGCQIYKSEKNYFSDYQLSYQEENWLSAKKKEARKTKNSQASELLFIEQTYKYLKPHGILAIVLPDGVLTSESLQYARDFIMSWFQILAVISIPQYAFIPTGAGVKCSILFLKKNSVAETQKIIDTSINIKKEVLQETDYFSKMKDIKDKFKGKDRKRELDKLKNAAIEDYLGRCSQSMPNYKIFMSIVENIGYDATGKDTSKNDLDVIEQELANFLKTQI